MTLGNDDLSEFAELWREEFKENLSLDEARHYATSLVELYTLLARPLPDARGSRSENDAQHQVV